MADSTRETIEKIVRSKEIMQNINDDQVFFDLGVSSLTVVELQVLIEKELKTTVETSELMRYPTLAGWVKLYQDKTEQNASSDADLALS